MIAPLTASGIIGERGALVSAVGIGVAFGIALERGGLGSARKLAGQFYLTDFTVFRVMFTAIITAMLGAFLLARVGVLDLGQVYVPETFIVPQLVGGVLFGTGFVLAGLCPGTSCVAAATGRIDGLVVVGGMLLGVFGFSEAFPAIRSLANATPRGVMLLPATLGVPAGLVIVAIVTLALVGFAIASRLEGKSSVTVNRPLVGLASMGAIVIAVTGAVNPPGSVVQATVTEISPVVVAALVRDGSPRVHVYEVGASDEPVIPGAHPIQPSDRTLTELPPGDTAVLYGPDARVVSLLALSRPNAPTVVMRGGDKAWRAEVLSPSLPADASPAQRAEFGRAAELSRWFGGQPSLVQPSAQPESDAAPSGRRTWRGC